jgi:Uma2 family endonuclease
MRKPVETSTAYQCFNLPRPVLPLVSVSTLPESSVLVSIDEYLAGELRSETKHEYLGGIVYAMAGASEEHNVIAANLIGMLHAQLRGKPCQPFGSEMKVRIETLGDTYFYYPDAMIACDPSDSGHGWRARPAVLFEILSEETRRLEEREKRFAYLQIPSLEAYIRIEQSSPELIVERRTPAGWKSEKFTGLDGAPELPGLTLRLPLAEVYERMRF